MKKFIYQIYYNEETQKEVSPGFIPLNNIQNLRPDWYEFWVILNYLRKNELEEHAWYGFLSPKFEEKSGYSSEFVNAVINQYGQAANVALFSPGWDQLSYFLNPFEQGDFWHPGLKAISQAFLNQFAYPINLNSLVTDSYTSVFSNYIIAKREFWNKWKSIAEQFFEYVENNPEFQKLTTYGTLQSRAPMKTFIQERLASLILASNSFTVINPDNSSSAPIFTKIFLEGEGIRKTLQSCNLMKGKFREKGDEEYLKMYWRLRADITVANLNFN